MLGLENGEICCEGFVLGEEEGGGLEGMGDVRVGVFLGEE